MTTRIVELHRKRAVIRGGSTALRGKWELPLQQYRSLIHTQEAIWKNMCPLTMPSIPVILASELVLEMGMDMNAGVIWGKRK